MKESETVEFKTSTSELKEGMISIVAILNKHRKGKLYFGIKNDGTPIGQTVTEKTLRDISQKISNHVEPKIFPEIVKLMLDEKECIQISFEGHDSPYFAYGRSYIRVADEDRPLSAKELENMILRKDKVKWDSKYSGISIDDIDEQALKTYIQRSNASGRISFMYTSKRLILNKLDLIKRGHLLNAAEILFSKKEPSEVQAAVFAGTDKTTFLDIKQFKGNIFQLLDLSESYIKQHMDWRAELKERTRKEIPEIPLRAITEALVNSFCHRDFQAPESNKIAIYKDRIEIWNPGDFPEEYKPEDFIKNDIPSILRNPLIANTLYLSSDIEKWGSGIKRIFEECKMSNVKVDFKVMKYGFSVIFTRPKFAPVNAPVNASLKLSELQQNILEEIKKDNKITYDELSGKLNTHRTTIMRNISQMKESEIIKRVGSDKAGYWAIQ